MAGFEPAASTSQMWRDTGLRYIPIGIAKVEFLLVMQNKKAKIYLKKFALDSNCIITRELIFIFFICDL
jgi:hypothetical protein